jgi:predicted transcriptional regulator
MIIGMDSRKVEIDPDVLKRLQVLAEARGSTRDGLAEAALRSFVEYEEHELEALRKGIRELDAGEGIPHEDLIAELRSRITEKMRSAAE